MQDNQNPEFPSLSEVEEHVEKQADQHHPKRRWTQWVIIFLVVLIIGLGTIQIVKKVPLVFQNGKGSVSGIVVNRMATPVSADIFLLQTNLTATTDSNGAFILRNVPTGIHQVIVAYDGMGQEIQVDVQAGTVVDLGHIQVETTQVAPAQ